jgi:hypothetical protein
VASAPRELKLRLVEEVNRDRKAEGRAPVEFSEELSQAADAHCREMLAQGYMSHWNRAGWKPYLRYAAAGVRDATAENVYSVWQTRFDRSEAQLWNAMRDGHRSFMAEMPPNDGHRRAILDPRQTRVGIGVAFSERGMRMIEVYGARYAQLEPVPLRPDLKKHVIVRGRVLSRAHELMGIAIYYEPLPAPMSVAELTLTGSYGLPSQEHMELPMLAYGSYTDGSGGSVRRDHTGAFMFPLSLQKKKPGVYTIVVWLRDRGGRQGFMGAMTSVLVEQPARPAGH